MATLTRVQTASAPVPWRTLALLALLIALIGGAVVFYVGRSAPLPEPFGPAANGVVAYEWAGNIHTVDPRTGATTAITTGIAQDREPVFSPDGTRIVFQRLVDGVITLVAADADGGNPVILDGRFEEGPVSFSPDGTAVLAPAIEDGRFVHLVVPTDGSAARVAVPGRLVGPPVWRPTAGQILFRGAVPGEEMAGLYLTDESGVRTLVPPRPGTYLGDPVFSPDGSRIVYTEGTDSPEAAEVRLLTVDTGVIEEHELPPGVPWQEALAWSNDGESVAMRRSYRERREESIAIVPSSDLSAVGIEIARDVPLSRDVEWAPDDSALLGMQIDSEGHRYQLEPVLIDPTTGEVRPAPWDSRTPASWQRVAP